MTRLPPAWRVRVEKHAVARWTIPQQVLIVNAISAREARVAAARAAHVRAGVAPWKPWLRATYLRTSVLERIPEHGSEAGRRHRTPAASGGIEARLRGAPARARDAGGRGR